MKVIKLEDLTLGQMKQVAHDDLLIDAIVNCERQDLSEFEFAIVEHDGNVVVVDNATLDSDMLYGVLENSFSHEWYDKFIDDTEWHSFTFDLRELQQIIDSINNPINQIIEHHVLSVADILLGF